MKKIIKNDMVVVIAGRDKGTKGKVLKVEGDKVLVENVNVRKKHVKANPQMNIEGGIVSVPRPIHVSNVAILNPENDKADRVGIRVVEEEGKKVRRERFYKSTGAKIENLGR